MWLREGQVVGAYQGIPHGAQVRGGWKRYQPELASQMIFENRSPSKMLWVQYVMSNGNMLNHSQFQQ